MSEREPSPEARDFARRAWSNPVYRRMMERLAREAPVDERIWVLWSDRIRLGTGERLVDCELSISDDGIIGLDDGESVGLPLEKWDEMIEAYLAWRQANKRGGRG